MAFTCGFFNSQNGDRKYNAEQMASIFDGLIKDGVYDTIGDIFAVTPGTGMQVLVGSGRAWFDHTWNNNDASYPLAITAADVSLPRYDAVVLETNHSDTVRTNRLRVVTGTPASNPAKPTMTSTENVKQHPLAYIKVTAGATAITQSMIEVVVGTSECPFVTGIIQTAQIDALFQQWNGEFDEWFENLKAQLSDNVVANLQNQIDQKVAKSDVATTADIEAGTSTTKWVTPKGLREAGIDGGEVGDIKSTIRTNINDRWALCNGEEINADEYPELFKYVPMKTNINNLLQSYFAYYDIFYYDGLWVAVGTVGARSNKQFICTATNPTDIWNTTIIENDGNFNSIYCYNGTWVIGASNGKIYYTSDPTGNWTEKKISDRSIRQIYCYNGTWVAVITSTPTYLYYTDNITGQWDSKTFEIGMYCITCYNGLWVMAGAQSTIYFSTSISGNWTSKTIGDRMSYNTICCHNGQWRIGGYSTYTGNIPYVYSNSGDISGDWTGSARPQNSTINKIFCSNNGRWIELIFTSSNSQFTISDSTTVSSSSSLVTYSDQSFASVYGLNNTFIAVGSYRVSGAYSGSMRYSNNSIYNWELVGNNNANNTYVSANNTGKGIYCNNEKWVFLSQESSNGRIYVSTTNDPYGPWYGKNVMSSTALKDVFYYNGTWVLTGYLNTSGKAVIYTATDPNGPWSLKFTSTNALAVNRIYCYNGTWVICANNGYILVANDPNGPWTEKSITTEDLTSIFCYDGIWVMVGSTYNRIYRTTNPLDDWTSYTIPRTINFNSVYCYNGIWIAGGYNSSFPYIYITTDPNGIWIEKQLPSVFGSNITCIYNYNGKWILTSSAFIATAFDPYSIWTVNELNSSISVSSANIWIASNNDFICIARNNYYTQDLINVLPTVSIDGCYSYIKVK